MGVAERWLETIGRKLDEEAERIVEVDRVHEAAILDSRVPDLPLVEPLDGLREGRVRDRERDVVHAADVRGGSGRIRLALLVREDRDEAPVARIEVEMALGFIVEVGLLEDERHSEHAFPEVDRGPAIRPDDRDVMDTLAL